MAETYFADEWLAQSLTEVLSPELLTELRAKAQPGQTLWETLVAQKIASDEQILAALSLREGEGSRGTRATLSLPAAPHHRLLSRDRDREPVRPRRREDARLRHGPRRPA